MSCPRCPRPLALICTEEPGRNSSRGHHENVSRTTSTPIAIGCHVEGASAQWQVQPQAGAGTGGGLHQLRARRQKLPIEITQVTVSVSTLLG